MNISGKLIDAFLALAETRRFSAAAERCHVTPSAFSQMIGRLEDAAGVRLFDRTTRRVELTPEGEVFEVGARRIAAETENALREVHNRLGQRTGRISIAAVPSIASGWLPRQLSIYHAQHPSIELQMWDGSYTECIRMVAQSEADFCIVNARTDAPEAYESQHLLDEPFMVLCATNDDLAAMKQVTPKHLKQKTLVRMAARDGVALNAESVAKAAGMHVSSLTVSHFTSLSGLVAEGFGLGLIPSSASTICMRPGVVAIPFAPSSITRSLYLVRQKNRSLSTAAAAIWNQIVTAAATIQDSLPRRDDHTEHAKAAALPPAYFAPPPPEEVEHHPRFGHEDTSA